MRLLKGWPKEVARLLPPGSVRASGMPSDLICCPRVRIRRDFRPWISGMLPGKMHDHPQILLFEGCLDEGQ
jgi:hypothetical protein